MAADNEIDIRIAADATGVDAGMAEASAATEAGAAQMQEAVAAMAATFEASSVKIQASIHQIGQATHHAHEESEGFFHSIIEKAEGVNGAIAGIGKAFTILAEAAAIGFIGEKLMEMGEKAGEYGEEIEHAAQKTGIAAEELQALDFAANMSGVQTEGLNKALQHLSVQMANAKAGAGPAAEAFRAVGLSAEEVHKMPLPEALEKISEKFAETRDGASKTAVAVALFGARGGSQLIPFLNKGKEGMEELTAKAQELGVVMSDEMIERAAKLGESFKETKAQTEAAANTIGATMAPAFEKINELIGAVAQSLANDFKPAWEAIGDVIVAVIEVIESVFGALKTIVLSVLDVIGAGFADVFGADAPGHVNVLIGALKGFETFLVALKTGILFIVEVIRTGFQQLADEAERLSIVTGKLFHLDFAGAAAAWRAGEKKIEDDLHASGERMVGIAEETNKRLAEIWSDTPEGPKKEKKESDKPDLPFNPNKQKADLMKHLEEMLSEEKKNWVQTQNERGTFLEYGIKEEQSFWERVVSMTAAGSKERATVETKINNLIYAGRKRDLEIELGDLKAKLEANKNNGEERVKIEQQIADKIKGAYTENSPQYKAAQKELTAVTMEESLKRTDAEIKSVEEAQRVKIVAIDEEIALIKKREQQGLISHQEALTAEAEYLTKRLQLEQEAALAEETLYAENPYSNPQKLNEMYDKASVITAQGMKKITEIQEQQLSQWQEIAMAMGKALSSQVGTQLTKLIEGTTNLRNAFRQTFLAIADAGVKAFAEIMAKELEHFIMSKVLTKEKKAEEVSSNAGAAAAAAFKSAADIPYVGWIIAPAAAAAAYAGAMAYAEDGYDIPAGVNPITQLHQREMVLPAKQADVIRNMADQGGGAGGGNYTINIHAVDAPSVKKLFTDNSSALVAALKSNSRLGGVPSS